MRKNSTCLSWKCIRKYYSFSNLEINFLKMCTIQRIDGNWYETLYQRIITHLEDNLITVTSGIKHDCENPGSDDVLSPTGGRLAVFHWLTLIEQHLPAYIAHVYAHDLQTVFKRYSTNQI